MLLILLSWIYILFTTINLGFGIDKIIKLKQKNFAITSILGLISTTILASIWAFFGRINIEFHVFLLVLNCLLFLKYRSEIRLKYQLLVEELKNLKVPLQPFLCAITILIITQCSTAPYVIDNESYYIQTIKWLNEYGFVKGLANLHIFFGQTSGWHIAQSAFNFSFLYPNFNDLSGFCLLLGNLFAILKLNSYFTNENKNYLIVGLVPLANLFFFQFISAPSPDLPVYILTFILFYYFIKNFSKTTIESFNLITILIFFIIFIKPIFFPFLIFPIVLLLLNYQNLYKKLLSTTVIGVLFGVILLSKNIIISGFPLFPLTNFQFLKFDFSVPKDVANFYFNDARLYRFFVTNREFHTLTTFQIATKWLFASKINAIFNILTIAVMAVSPAIIYKFYNKKSIWIIYLVTVIQMFFLIFSSPIFRFFIHLTLFFIFLIFASWLPLKKYIMSAYTFCTIIIILVLFVPISFSGLTKNKLISKNSNFSIQNIIFPHNNTKTEMQYEVVENGNLKYNSPLNNTFFWRTGNGELPCINKEQLDYFANYLSVYPQMRTSDLKDGFYAKRLVPNEKSELKSFLDEKVDLYNNPNFIDSDPIQIPHCFSVKEDIEIAGFLSATIAWGNRKMIINNSKKMMDLMGNSPYDFVINHQEYHLEKLEKFVHRTFNGGDFTTFIKGLQNIYTNHKGLENVFSKNIEENSMQKSISEFKKVFFEIEHQNRTQKHISDPLNNSAAKRINMLIQLNNVVLD